jgi:hypothetical protein
MSDKSVSKAINGFLDQAFVMRVEVSLEDVCEAMVCATSGFISSGYDHKKAAEMLRNEAMRLDPPN